MEPIGQFDEFPFEVYRSNEFRRANFSSVHFFTPTRTRDDRCSVRTREPLYPGKESARSDYQTVLTNFFSPSPVFRSKEHSRPEFLKDTRKGNRGRRHGRESRVKKKIGSIGSLDRYPYPDLPFTENGLAQLTYSGRRRDSSSSALIFHTAVTYTFDPEEGSNRSLFPRHESAPFLQFPREPRRLRK